MLTLAPMKLPVRAALLLLLGTIAWKAPAQRIKNPSFEGTPQWNAPPPPWFPCKTFSTPDTQPGFYEVNQPASQGATYLGMVTRGNLGPYANTTEAVQTKLVRPLVAGKSYDLGIDLAFSDKAGHYVDWDFLSYANPVILKVWGAADSCATTELLWQSPAISHTDWRTYDFTLAPQLQDVRYLVLEVEYTALPAYFGNLLIDNLVEKDLPGPSANRCNLEAFNVFTPNGDGSNDQFRFRPVSSVARFAFKVCNRWGTVLFETNSLAEGWDGTHHGTDCPPSVYFWYTEFMCIEDDQLFNNNMKGSVTLIR